MKRDYINAKGSIEDALKEVPNHLSKEDWEWLVKKHYQDENVVVRYLKCDLMTTFCLVFFTSRITHAQ